MKKAAYKKPKTKRYATSKDVLQSFATKKYVKHAISTNLENKQVNGSHELGDISTNAGFSLELVSPSQGTDYNERIGTDIRLKQLSFKYMVNRRTDKSHALVRLIVFYWSDPTNVPTINDIIFSGGSSDIRPLQPYLKVKRGRFQVLYDRTFMINSFEIAGMGQKTINLKNKKISFEKNSSHPYFNNSLYMVCTDNHTSSVEHYTAMDVAWKVTYEDA